MRAMACSIEHFPKTPALSSFPPQHRLKSRVDKAPQVGYEVMLDSLRLQSLRMRQPQQPAGFLVNESERESRPDRRLTRNLYARKTTLHTAQTSSAMAHCRLMTRE